MDDGLRLPQVIQEGVPKPPSQVGIRHKPRNVDQFHGYIADALNAMPAALTAGDTGALGAHIGDPAVGIDGGERIIRDLNICHRRGLKKSGFPGIGFPCKSYGH